MKVNPSWYVFFSFLLAGIALMLSSTNWFLMWVGFELALLSFLPMFVSSYVVIESQIKYFLVQAVGSALFMVSFLSALEISGQLCCLGMILKLGLFPCYQWVPSVMNSLPWEGCLILVTLQKIPAFVVLYSLSVQMSYVFAVVGAFSIMLSGVIGFNQSVLRPLMAYSSIAHTGWLILALMSSVKLLMLYYVFYTCVVSVLFMNFKQLAMKKVVGGGGLLKFNLALPLLVLNVGGLPPFSMFFLKLSIIMMVSGFFYLFPIILLGMVLTIYYYLVLVIPMLMVYWQSQSLEVVTSSGVFCLLFLSLGYPLFFMF